VATLNGTIQPPPAGWDPYASPGSGAPSLFGQEPYAAPGQFQLAPMFNQMYRLVRDVSFDYHWFSGHGSSNNNQLGINDVELAASINLPLPITPQAPLTVTPGFAFHFWDGPHSTPPVFAEMPPQTFDAYVDLAWNPHLTPILGTELDVQTGVFSDFRELTGDSLRLKAKGMAVLSYLPTIQIKAGVWYLDRERVKLLPAGGIVWTPTPDVRLDILFPNPRFSQRLATTNNTDWWWYVSGDYGGGVWTIKRVEGPDAGNVDLVDYNDIRIALGVEFKRLTSGLTGLFEVGGAFDRSLDYRSLSPSTFYPQSAFFLRAGLMF